MDLNVFRQLSHVSPSTFIKWKGCQFRIYLTRLAGNKFMKQKQGLAAAIGSAFDVFIKHHIAEVRGIKLPITLKKMLIEQVEHPEAVAKGRHIAMAYLKTDLLTPFLETTETLLLDQELIHRHNNVPILGQLDLIYKDIPFDWKTRGFASKYSTSPFKGYTFRTDYNELTGNCTEQAVDPMKLTRYHLEEVNLTWAIQMLFYNWCLRKVTSDFKYIIHEIVKQKDRIVFAVHKGTFSTEFIEKISGQLEAMWTQITDKMYYAEIEEPTPSKSICEAYKIVCEAAPLCKFYENTLGHPDRREDYV